MILLTIVFHALANYTCYGDRSVITGVMFVTFLLLLLRCIAGAPRTEHYQLVRALSAGAVVTVL